MMLSQVVDLTAIDPTLVQVDPAALPDPNAVNSYLNTPPLAAVDLSGTDPSLIDSATAQAATAATSSGGFNLSQFVTSLAQGTAIVANALALGKAPQNTAAHPPPGTQRALPNGGMMVTNADGSTTITSPTGAKQTILPNGKIIQGGAPMLGGLGISNQTLALIGVGVGALFFLPRLLRRR
jgi:hypothetical protein